MVNRHAYTKLEERLALATEYERYMHRNYTLEGAGYHALHVSFMSSGHAYVVLSSIAVPKDRLIISLSDFNDLAGGGDNGKTD